MKRVRWFFSVGLLLAQAAHAQPPVDTGTVLARDAYRHYSATTGRLDGFRRLYVDPSAFADAAKPLDGSVGTGRGSVRLHNPSTAWVDVSVNGQRVGRVGPLVDAWIRDVPAGKYAVSFALPNGHTWEASVAAE